MSHRADDQRTVEALREKVKRFLADVSDQIITLADGRFLFREGSTQVVVQCGHWHDIDNTVVHITAPIAVLVPKTAALYEYVAQRSNRFPFARLWTEDMKENMSGVFAGWNLIGDDLDPMEFIAAARNVAVAADTFDDEVRRLFGGVAGEALSFE